MGEIFIATVIVIHEKKIIVLNKQQTLGNYISKWKKNSQEIFFILYCLIYSLQMLKTKFQLLTDTTQVHNLCRRRRFH